MLTEKTETNNVHVTKAYKLNHVCLRTKIYEKRNKMLTQIPNLWLVYFNFYYYDEVILSLYMTSGFLYLGSEFVKR